MQFEIHKTLFCYATKIFNALKSLDAISQFSIKSEVFVAWNYQILLTRSSFYYVQEARLFIVFSFLWASLSSNFFPSSLTDGAIFDVNKPHRLLCEVPINSLNVRLDRTLHHWKTIERLRVCKISGLSRYVFLFLNTIRSAIFFASS